MMRYRESRHGSQLKVKYEYFRSDEVNVPNETPNHGACPRVAEARCDNNATCASTGVPSQWVQISGQNYGYCQ